MSRRFVIHYHCTIILSLLLFAYNFAITKLCLYDTHTQMTYEAVLRSIINRIHSTTHLRDEQRNTWINCLVKSEWNAHRIDAVQRRKYRLALRIGIEYNIFCIDNDQSPLCSKDTHTPLTHIQSTYFHTVDYLLTKHAQRICATIFLRIDGGMKVRKSLSNCPSKHQQSMQFWLFCCCGRWWFLCLWSVNGMYDQAHWEIAYSPYQQSEANELSSYCGRRQWSNA